jgi:ketol-acid reductoisomerase
MALNIYYDKDADLGRLEGVVVAVLGYGSQGHAHAQNLKHSGVEVVVGLRKESPSWAKAEDAGLRVLTPAEAAHQADVIMMTLPDESMADIYREHVESNLQPGNYLAVAHGFNFHFGVIEPPAGVNVFMVAPKGPGRAVRAQYEQGRGLPSLVAVHQDPSGDTLQIALAYAAGIGAGRAGIIETTFREETETDLFGEQTVLCGEMAYFETIHEVKLIVDLIYEGGVANMGCSVSNTAEYGGLTRGPRVIDASVRARMREILEEIQSGRFAKEFILENRSGGAQFEALRKRGRAHPMEEVGARLRNLMPWLKENRLVDRAKH